MMAELKALDPTTVGVLAAFVLSNAGAILGAYTSIISRLTRIETKQDEAEKRHDRELDGLARVLGTERSKAEAAAAVNGTPT